MPPPPPPPPPGMPAFKAGAPSSGGDGRNLLLQSIRTGAKLKKVTQINDRSAPLVSGEFSN